MTDGATGWLKLEDFTEAGALVPGLTSAGLTLDAARAKAALFQRSAGTLRSAGLPGDTDVAGFFVPGRVEVVGKHTDYAGGRSLMGAVDRGFCMLVHPRQDRTICLLRADGQGESSFELHPDLTPADSGWTNYPMTVARRLARNFEAARRGADIAFISDLPLASGLSSSSAMIVMMYLALARVNELEKTDVYQRELQGFEALAGYLGTLENGQTFGALVGDRGVGTFGGSEDHTAIIASQAGVLSQFAYCPVRLERRVALPQGYTMAVAFSGAHAEKTGSARDQYNDAAQLAREAVKVWNVTANTEHEHLASVIASCEGDMEPIWAAFYDHSMLLERFQHFYAENEQIVPQAGDALLAGDIARFGRIVDRSQDLTERLLRNQVEQTVHLARAARTLGADAASAFGAGFGGSVWAMIHRDRLDGFLAEWTSDYAQAFPQHVADAEFFPMHPGPAAFELRV